MSQSRTGKTSHDLAVAAADGTMQSAVNAATTQAQANPAAIVYYRAVLASCITNSLDVGPPIFALKTLGAAV
jgi:hypothetical protein